MATQTRNPMTDVFEQLNESFTKTFETGLKFQEETARFWTRLFEQSVEQGRDQFARAVDATAPFTKENTERFQRLFDQQANNSLKMLRETFDGGPVSRPGDALDKVSQLWRSSFETFREATETFAKSNGDMLQNWNRMVRQSTTPADGRPAPKPATK